MQAGFLPGPPADQIVSLFDEGDRTNDRESRWINQAKDAMSGLTKLNGIQV